MILSSIASQKTAYFQTKSIGVGVRLVSDVIDIFDKLNKSKVLLTSEESCVINGDISSKKNGRASHSFDWSHSFYCVLLT